MKTEIALNLIALTVGPLTLFATAAISAESPPKSRPNFVVIFVDDMGYGDLGCFGSEVHRTPHLDQMAREGMMLTDFYSACSVCTPSRASLLTGCYPRRINMHVNEDNLCVLFPVASKGLNPSEITIAELVKEQGYATMCIGKWHLGDHPCFLPTAHGFDHYFGIPYSNDMRSGLPNRDYPDLPLLRDKVVIEAPVEQSTITERYTEEAIRFIKSHQNQPFFLYLPHTAIHTPLFPGKPFQGKSQDGPYGDWVEEVDSSTGRILEALKTNGIDENTLVLFTTDNGSPRAKAGSNLPLRGRKGRTDEGGMRVPCIARWPTKIPLGSTCREVAGTIDLLPTIAKLAGSSAPTDRIIDGRDIWPLLSGAENAQSPHEAFLYYQMDQLQAVRSGDWKLFVPMEAKKRNWGEPEGKTDVKLFNLASDIHEDKNVASKHPDIVAKLLTIAEQARKDIGDVGRPGVNQRSPGWVSRGKPLLLSQ